MNILVIDIGGTRVKILATSQDEPRQLVSGPKLTPRRMAAGVKKLARGWKYDVISMGYPGVVHHGRPIAEPHNLGKGWVRFDYQTELGRPVKMVNDAALSGGVVAHILADANMVAALKNQAVWSALTNADLRLTLSAGYAA